MKRGIALDGRIEPAPLVQVEVAPTEGRVVVTVPPGFDAQLITDALGRSFAMLSAQAGVAASALSRAMDQIGESLRRQEEDTIRQRFYAKMQEEEDAAFMRMMGVRHGTDE